MRRSRDACLAALLTCLSLWISLLTGLPALATVDDNCNATFKQLPDMLGPHSGHLAILLKTGKVILLDLSVLGQKRIPPGCGELYDPKSNRFSDASGLEFRYAAGQPFAVNGIRGANPKDPGLVVFALANVAAIRDRSFYAATFLRDGKILLTGGSVPVPDRPGTGRTVGDILVVDPVKCTAKKVGQLSTPRAHHTVSLLPDGRVLVCGGVNGRPLRSAEFISLRDFQTTPAGNMRFAHAFHSATSLGNGNVLILGGMSGVGDGTGDSSIAKAELFVRKGGQFCPLGEMGQRRRAHASILLADGRILIAGGENTTRDYEEWTPLKTAEVCIIGKEEQLPFRGN